MATLVPLHVAVRSTSSRVTSTTLWMRAAASWPTSAMAPSSSKVGEEGGGGLAWLLRLHQY